MNSYTKISLRALNWARESSTDFWLRADGETFEVRSVAVVFDTMHLLSDDVLGFRCDLIGEALQQQGLHINSFIVI